MGNSLGKMGLGRGRAIGLGIVILTSPLLLTLAACGSGDDAVADLPNETTEEPPSTEPGPLPCSEDRHMVAFDIIGFLTVENIQILGSWDPADGSTAPTPRPGSVDLVQAYRQKGYEVLYLTTLPPDIWAGRTVVDVVTQWLQTGGYPVGDGTHVWAWDGQTRPDDQTWVGITDELLRFAGEGVSVDASYTENEDKSYAFATGGVPEASNFTLTPVEGLGEAAPTSAPTSVIPNDDLVAHAVTIQALPPVCQVA